MIQINKHERDYLESKGFKMGKHIHRTYSHHKHYYAIEDKKLMKTLNKYRKRVTTEQ